MQITDKILAAARKHKPAAAREILRQAYPSVHRLACGLAGREDVARGIVRFVMMRSMRVMPSWREVHDPPHWYWRYTILMSRRATKHAANPGADLLLDDSPDPQNVAFIAALRKLPHQQQEAILLNFGEKAGTRAAAVAMDCSTLAYENHLAAATDALRLVAADRFDEMIARLARRYTEFTPNEDLILPKVSAIVRRHIWPRRILRLLIVAAIAAAAYFAWRLHLEF